MKRGISIIVLLLVFFLPATANIPFGHATSSERRDPNQVIVGFWNNTENNARAVSAKYGVRAIEENDALRFAVFSPSDGKGFISALKHEQMAKYVESNLASCLLSSGCGGGGGGSGGGGSGSATSDFSVTSSPSHLALLPGAYNDPSTITLTSINRFYGTVTLTATSSAGFVDASLDRSSVLLNYTGSSATQTVTLYVSCPRAAPIGTYSVVVNATNAPTGFFHTTTLIVDITSDFSVSGSPTSLGVADGQTGASTITVTSPGFSGTVYLAATVSPNGPSVTMSPSSVALSAGGSATSTLSILTGNNPLGGYIVAVVGNNQAVTHTTVVTASILANDPLYSNQWALNDLNLPQAWATTLGTRNRVIAVVDSGAYFDHPDLQGVFWTAADGSHGWDFVHGNNNPVDDLGHGTLVTGVLDALTNNGVGIAGAAQEQIMEVKSWDYRGETMTSWLADGIQWAVDHGANVINMSWETSDSITLHNAITYASQQGVVLVAAAGNEGASQLYAPASYSEVIAVSALMQGDVSWNQNNVAPKIELSAPGVNILTTCWPGSTIEPGCLNSLYASENGTSFASPYVAAIAALTWDYAIHKSPYPLSSQNIRDALDSYVTALGIGGRNNQFGYGKPNALTVLQNMISSHSFSTYARWDFFGSSGTERSAKVYVYDDVTDIGLLLWPQVGSGQTVSVVTGHNLDVQYVHCFNDGSNNVALDHVEGTGGAPSGTVPATTPFTFTMGAVSASVTAVYDVVPGC